MKIHIEDNVGTEEIKKKFRQAYPYLKLEFFRSSHKEGEASKKTDLISEDLLLKDIRTKHNDGEFEISADNTVNDIEQGFEQKYGVHVQVFRKSKSIWLETTATDDWTLREQNKTAKELEHYFKL